MPQQDSIDSLVDLKKATIDQWQNDIYLEKKLHVDILRLDKIHPVISGNKWFKLKDYLKNILDQNTGGVISAGGAYSNHLSALAYACKELGIPSIAAIRGEEPNNYSSTLKDLKDWGMQLEFVPRDFFRNETLVSEKMLNEHPGYSWIPMGGEGLAGITGVRELYSHFELSGYSHICCSVGTGTFLMGLLEWSGPDQQILGVSSLKANTESQMIEKVVRSYSSRTNFKINYDYHFGGFGKADPKLIHYMNNLFDKTGIPSDFVYTARLFFGIEDLASKDYFSPESHILVIHSGGLQGNRSLPPKTLSF